MIITDSHIINYVSPLYFHCLWLLSLRHLLLKLWFFNWIWDWESMYNKETYWYHYWLNHDCHW